MGHICLKGQIENISIQFNSVLVQKQHNAEFRIQLYDKNKGMCLLSAYTAPDDLDINRDLIVSVE